MGKPIVLVKRPTGLVPATAMDQELLDKWPLGQGIRCEVTQLKPRSVRHHRMYWGGLMALAMDYWEPTGGVITPSDRNMVHLYSKWLGNHGSDPQAFLTAGETFLAELAASRAQKYEAPVKSLDGLHVWVKEQAGYFDLLQTPEGVRKQAVSINFNSMDQDEFNDFYKAAFSAIWQFILSRSFDSEEQANDAVHQLLAMG